MNKKKMLVLAILLIVFFLVGYFLLLQKKPISAGDIKLQISAKEQTIEVKLWHNYYDNKNYLFLPSFCEENVTAQISAKGKVYCQWDNQDVYSWQSIQMDADGQHRLQIGKEVYDVVVMRSAKLPALVIKTQSGSLSYIEAKKGNIEAGTYQMLGENGECLSSGQLDKMKARGNVTFLEDKKPYQITLKDSADLLGTGQLHNYILLANRQDQSLLRDKIMYDMAEDIGLAYSPHSRFVDLYINDEYRGNYLLSEKVEAAPNRIEIDSESGKEETGFLITLEYSQEERLSENKYYFTTENNQNVVVKSPNNPTAKQLKYIEKSFQAAETAIREGKLDYAGIDASSFAKKYLIEEIGKNLDAMYASQYFYQDAPKKEAGENSVKTVLYAGPAWDYDKALGNPLIEHNRDVNFQEPWGLFAAKKREDASWWYDLYKMPEFQKWIKQEYKDFAVPAIEMQLQEKIDEYSDTIHASAYMDYMRWDPFEDFKYERELDFDTAFATEKKWIKSYLKDRKQFLDAIWIQERKYDQIALETDYGVLYVKEAEAVEGYPVKEPRDPKDEDGIMKFDYWVRTDTGLKYDFADTYDGNPFTLKAVWRSAD